MTSLGDFNIDKHCSCKKILVVDDLAFNLFAAELMMKNKFHITVDKAFSGDEAIAKVKQKLMSPWWKSYKLILMDYYMPPGMNGAEASLKIKQVVGKLKQKSFIAWLTSQREGDFEFNKSMKNFDKFFSKPINVDELKKVMLEIFHIEED
jgi:CheY-like chemotaxis protein